MEVCRLSTLYPLCVFWNTVIEILRKQTTPHGVISRHAKSPTVKVVVHAIAGHGGGALSWPVGV